MDQYRGQVRRHGDPTPTKSSWQNQKNNFQQLQQQKYSRNKNLDKSQLSYCQSEQSHTVYDNEITQSQRYSQKTRNINENKQLYDNSIPIKVQSPEKEQYSTYLRVQIINTVEKGMNKLTLYLTDDKDPKFLWLFFIKQNDFMTLKKQQKLRVDFRGFPSMLMDHFDMCKSDKQASNSINMGQCYFFSLFETKKNQGSLNILQANKYKQSVHLSLKCKLGNDQQIKQYLSQKLLKAQSQNANLRTTMSNLEQTLSVRKEEISRVEVELKQQRKANQKSHEQHQIQTSRVMTELKREKIQNQERIKNANEKQFKEMKRGLEQQMNKYIKSYDELRQKHELSLQKLASLQSKQRQSNFDISIKSKQIETYVKRLQQMKAYTVQLQNKRTSNQKIIIEQTVRIQSLQSQISDKLRIIQSNVELKSTKSQQISSLQTKGQEYKKQVEKLQLKVESLQSQLQKVECLLEEYRQKYQKKKEKNQEKNNIIKQQQRYINEKENQIFDVKRQLQTKEKLLDEARLDGEDKDRRANELRRQIQECQKKIKQDNDLITHLQKQLNERTIGIRTGYGPTTSYQRPTSPFSSNISSGNRQYLNTNSSLGNTTTSRLKFTSGDNNNQQVSDRGTRKEIQIKRYTPTNTEQGVNRERSKSPILNSRLNQQRDPQQNKAPGVVKPVKFKFSQRE